jgi:hypothetical protein
LFPKDLTSSQILQGAEKALISIVEYLLLVECVHVVGVGEFDLLLVAAFIVLLTLVVCERIVEGSSLSSGSFRSRRCPFCPQTLLLYRGTGDKRV